MFQNWCIEIHWQRIALPSSGPFHKLNTFPKQPFVKFFHFICVISASPAGAWLFSGAKVIKVCDMVRGILL